MPPPGGGSLAFHTAEGSLRLTFVRLEFAAIGSYSAPYRAAPDPG